MAEFIYLDIETIADPTPGAKEEIAATLEPPGNYKKEESIAKWREENAETAWHRTALDGAKGEIVCLGHAVDTHNAGAVYNMPERDMLREFFTGIEQGGWEGEISEFTHFVGHNIQGFDLPYFWHRCWVNNIRPPRFFPKPGDRRVVDTMLMWAFGPYDKSKMISLDNLAKALGVGRKTEGVDGSKVQELWEAGKFQEIANYCKDDVELTRAVHRRMAFLD